MKFVREDPEKAAELIERRFRYISLLERSLTDNLRAPKEEIANRLFNVWDLYKEVLDPDADWDHFYRDEVDAMAAPGRQRIVEHYQAEAATRRESIGSRSMGPHAPTDRPAEL